MTGAVLRLATLFALAVPATAAPDSRVFRAGVDQVDITPVRLPITISGGFLARKAERAEAGLHARALALDDGRERLVIAVVDTLMMPRELLDRVKAAAARATGVPPDRILISATHTHSAPPLMGALGTDEEPGYVAFVEPRLVAVIEGAVRRLAPARVGWGVIEDREHTHCRRWILRPDRIRLDPFGQPTVRAIMHPGFQSPDFTGPAGPADPALTLLAVQYADGAPMAVLANYSMHYVGAGGVVSPDYFGFFAENMERAVQAGSGNRPFVAMMSQGTSGDLQWMDYSRPKQEMRPGPYAEAVARVALEAWRRIHYRDWVPLSMAQATLRLRRRTPDAQRLAWARQIVAQMNGALPRNQVEVYAREQIYLAEEPERELILQAVRIGDLGIVAIPTEVFGITGLKIKAHSPLVPTMVITLANGAEGYIPPPEQHRLGGYTTWPARTAGLEIEAEPKITEIVLSLLERVAGRPRRPVTAGRDAYARAVLASRPLAYWRLEEFGGAWARDATGRGHDAAFEGGIAFYLEGPVGSRNHAVHLAGGRIRASLPQLGARYSVELWFWNALPPEARSVTGHLLCRGGERLGLGGTAGTPGRLFLSAGDARWEGPTTLPLREWNHVVLVRDGSRVSVYLNGRETPEIEATAPPSRGPEVILGGCEDGADSFEGKMDEIAVYARPLSTREVKRRFGAMAPRDTGN